MNKKQISDRYNLLSTLIHNIDDALIITDKDYKITSWNAGAERVYGWKHEEVIGKKASPLLKTIFSGNEKSEWENHIKRFGSWKGEVSQVTKSGSRIYVLASIAALVDEDNTIQGAIAVNRDITDRKRIEESLVFLSEASKVFSSSLDYEVTLQRVADLAVSHIADWCGIEMVHDELGLEQVVVVHKDPEKVKWAKALREIDPPDLNSPHGIGKVLKTGKPEYYPIVTEEMITAAIKSKRHLELLKKVGLTSVIIVPLIVHKKIIGVISLISAESKKQFSTTDLTTAEQLANRASLAIENALLYETMTKEKERVNNLIDNVPGIVWESWGNPDKASQRFNFVSHHVQRLLEYSVDEWLNKSSFWLDIVHPEDKERALAEINAIFASGNDGKSRFRWKTKSGKYLWVEAQASVVKDKKGKPIGMRGVTMNVTDRVEIEKRKDEFISMASHELKTPITSIKVFTQMLHKSLQKKGDDQSINYLSRMLEQIERLTRLVNDLLDVSKIQAGKLELRKNIFSLNKLVKETVETMQTTTDHHVIEIIGESTNELYGDEERVSQILINLLSNAIKYSPNANKITVTMREKNGKAIVGVTDYGVGIPQEHIHKIFERFYRVYDTTDRTFPGLGMGLYIAQQIIKRHKGEMWVESKAGNGSTFYFSLPSA